MTPRLYDRDFGWWRQEGSYGKRLSYNRATGVLYLFDADPFADQAREPLAFMTEQQAAAVGQR